MTTPITIEDVSKLILPDVQSALANYKPNGVFGFIWKPLIRLNAFAIAKIGVAIGVKLSRDKVKPLLDGLIFLLPMLPDNMVQGIDKEFLIKFDQLVDSPDAANYILGGDNGNN